jgi:chromosome segregation ATPase
VKPRQSWRKWFHSDLNSLLYLLVFSGVNFNTTPSAILNISGLCRERTAEIAALRAQAMERESRLRAAKSEIMEARAGAAEKEAKLVELYQILADSGAERARLREELAQTKMELVETQGDLESLADEILAMKELVLNDSELAELNAGILTAGAESSIPSEEVSDNSFESSMESISASAAAAAGGTWDVLQQLAEMSRQMLDDAKLDEEAFTGARFFKNLTSRAGVSSGNGAGNNQNR